MMGGRFAIIMYFLISWELLLLFDHFTLSSFDHFNGHKLEFKKPSPIYQGSLLMMVIAIWGWNLSQSTPSTVRLCCFLVSESGCVVIPIIPHRGWIQNLCITWISPLVILYVTLWWVVFVKGRHSPSFVESCQQYALSFVLVMQIHSSNRLAMSLPSK